ncbi:MAG TPA: HDOD domain-containing protein [Polyangiaceae bacterium]|jgi:putative nucleotidyltransferase with HDIG domain|nr:HDOD domain-containing protein [Polyangiaceae bacterium]
MSEFLQFVPSQAPAGESTEIVLPVMVNVEPTPEMSETERELVKRLRTGRAALPVLPQVAESALRLANDPDARITDLAGLVDTDPPIAARFMSVANSVAYWRGLLTSSTQSAIVRLGLANTRDLLFQVVYAASSGGLKRFQIPVQRSFKRSVVAAVAARTAARELSMETEYDYMSGLLHDIGEARIYRILDGLPRFDDPKLAKELVLRYHTAAGAEVAMAWKLPTEIVDACAAHHDPAAAAVPHVRLVMIADAVVDALDAGRNPKLDRFEALGVDVGVARRIIDQTKKAASTNARP